MFYKVLSKSDMGLAGNQTHIDISVSALRFDPPKNNLYCHAIINFYEAKGHLSFQGSKTGLFVLSSFGQQGGNPDRPRIKYDDGGNSVFEIIRSLVTPEYPPTIILLFEPLKSNNFTDNLNQLPLDAIELSVVYIGQVNLPTVRSLNTNKVLKSSPKSLSPPQLILQGPPGTGKSHYLKQKLKEYGLSDSSKQVERIVGHPELSSADFIGSYRPSTNDQGQLSYEFVMGPFTKLLKKARENLGVPHILIIEELNRCNAAAMFAEVFQLLDRDDEGNSEYACSLGQDVNKALGLGVDDKVKLPTNLAIWATINTADQGVFPMDTAFKRRWSFKYLGVNKGREEWQKLEWNPELPTYEALTWQSLRLGLNHALASVGIEEDRHLGGFFLSKRELKAGLLLESISTKVIGYLRDDVLRYEPQLLFKSDEQGFVPGFSRLLEQIEAQGLLSIFNSSILELEFHDVTKNKLSFQKVLNYIDSKRSVHKPVQEQANQTGGDQ